MTTRIAMADWISFWDTSHSIYANDRHRDVHYRAIAEDLRGYISSPDAMVMDYGCGEALHAGVVAAAAGRLILVEAAPGVAARLAERFSAERKIDVIAPDRLAEVPDRSVDLIALHSVAQYLSAEALDALLVRFRQLLKRDGLLIVGDIIPPDRSTLADVWSLLRLAFAQGFLGAALLGLIRTLMSGYTRLRTTLGLARYSAAAMQAKLSACGFSSERAAANIGQNQGRMTFLARPM